MSRPVVGLPLRHKRGLVGRFAAGLPRAKEETSASAYGRMRPNPMERASHPRHIALPARRCVRARQEKPLMNPMLWLVAGGILGWLANIEMGTDRRGSLALNVASGVIGALVAGGLLTLPLEPDAVRSGDLSLGALLVA